jgi:hypothetical protein
MTNDIKRINEAYENIKLKKGEVSPIKEEEGEEEEEDADSAPVCRGYHVDPRDPEYDPPGHYWKYKEASDGTTWRICKRCGQGDEA